MHIAPCKGQAYKVAAQLSCFCRPLTPGIKVGQPLQLAHSANERSLRQVCSRLQSRAGSNETSFRIPDADGFMGLPLQQTQKLDPKDPANFWKQHAPPSGRSAEFWGTEEGHSLLVEWDNGPFAMEEGFCTTAAYPRDTGLPMTVLIMANNILEHAGFAAVDPHLRVSQHPGDRFLQEHVFFVTLEATPRVTGNTGYTLSTDLSHVREFVMLNMVLLLQHWVGDAGSFSVLQGIKPVMPSTDEGKSGMEFFAKLQKIQRS